MVLSLSLAFWTTISFPHVEKMVASSSQAGLELHFASLPLRFHSQPRSVHMGNSNEVCNHSSVPNDQPGPCGFSGQDLFGYSMDLPIPKVRYKTLEAVVG